MTGRTAGVFVLLVCAAVAGFAQSDEEKLVREFAKKLAKERDPKERASAARWLGGRANPEAVSALGKALSDPDAKVRQAAASALSGHREKRRRPGRTTRRWRIRRRPSSPGRPEPSRSWTCRIRSSRRRGAGRSTGRATTRPPSSPRAA
jgi:hypothetical protein